MTAPLTREQFDAIAAGDFTIVGDDALLTIWQPPSPPAPAEARTSVLITDRDDEFRGTITALFNQELGHDPSDEQMLAYLTWARAGGTGEQMQQVLHDEPEALAYRARPKAPPRLHVVGEDFWTLEGEPWTMAFVSSFRLFERFLRGEDVAPLLQEAREVGANGVRVFGAFDFGSPAVQRLYPLEHGPAYYDLLPAFFELLGGYGLYAQFTVFADTARSVPGVVQQQAHFLDVCEVLRDVPNVLLERVNENDAHENRVEAPLPKPVGICSSFGSNGAGNDPPGPFWDYADLHAERRGDFALSTTTVHFAINGYGTAYPGTRRATVNSEPPGFADMTQPGRRTSDPRVAYRMGLGCRWGAGGTAHSDCGVHSVLLTPTQRACVEQFLRGVRG
jgi:hypothetical protein